MTDKKKPRKTLEERLWLAHDAWKRAHKREEAAWERYGRLCAQWEKKEGLEVPASGDQPVRPIRRMP